MCARAHTHTNAHTEAKNLFSRTFCTSRAYDDYGYLKIKGMANTWSAISQLQIDEIEKIQRGFQEYDFDFKTLHWATRITCFTCSTFVLLTALFLRIFYEIWNLNKNVLEARILRVVYESCIFLLQFVFFLFL